MIAGRVGGMHRQSSAQPAQQRVTTAPASRKEGGYLLRIGHPVADFAAWKAAFDSDPARRQAGGVRSYQVLRPVDDPNYALVDLEFDSPSQAEAFRAVLQRMWAGVQGSLIGTPEATIVERLESRSF